MDAARSPNVAGEQLRASSGTHPVGVLDRDKQLGVVKEAHGHRRGRANDSSLRERTWVLLTESPKGGWGIAGHANTNVDIAPPRALALTGR
jgi:hypothetical protein